MHNVVKWPNILQKSCSVHAARFLKYVWPFYNIMHERVNKILKSEIGSLIAYFSFVIYMDLCVVLLHITSIFI